MKRGLILFFCLLMTVTLAYAESTPGEILPTAQSGSLLSENASDLDNRSDSENSPDSGLDSTPLYESTQQFMDILTQNNRSCIYRGKQGPNSEAVYTTFIGNNTTLNAVAVFSDTETDCILYVLRFVDFTGKNPDLVSPLLDALNSECRFAKFYSAPNNSVSATLDLLFLTGNAGQICYDGLRRLLNICDECYPALSASISDLPDTGSVIAEAPAVTRNTYTATNETLEPDETETTSDTTTAAAAATAKNDEDASTSTSSDGETLMKIKVRSGGPFNVRQGPDQNSILLGTVEGGSVLDCVGKTDNGWYEILYYNGIHGFISGKSATEMK